MGRSKGELSECPPWAPPDLELRMLSRELPWASLAVALTCVLLVLLEVLVVVERARGRGGAFRSEW